MDLRCSSLLGSSDAEVRRKGVETALQLDLEDAEMDNSLPLLLKLSAEDDFSLKCIAYKFLRNLELYNRGPLSILLVNTLDKDRTFSDPALRFLALRSTVSHTPVQSHMPRSLPQPAC
eukprot:Blabericola_migrator_1__5623@NODE_285_length_10382_cov_182_229956_g235_i0_p9_GENE_NODE_285_length_10382_cov_182_229956_g235_i0NODE_285_length_10382_cov_182_229956_g235_i0_p9_ORF_typecomplete_len118_score19_03Adaptin_N/PF01602_20/6_1e08_NODE_285_length_10382_cov_182_229956_g235_i024462799